MTLSEDFWNKAKKGWLLQSYFPYRADRGLAGRLPD